MKKLLIYSSCALVLSSCDPEVTGEGVNLPEMEFGFKVLPDTAYIKIGDTVAIYATISNKLNNGIIIDDGKATIKSSFAFSEQIPVETNSFTSMKTGEHIDYSIEYGDLEISSVNTIGNIYAIPTFDSIKVSFKVIPLKTGTYIIDLYSSFYEGTKGKTRTKSFFNVTSNHFKEFIKIPGEDRNPGDFGYDNKYVFAVFE